MGGKPIGQWQQICICFALLIIVSGCGLFQESNRRWELREALTQGHQLLARGDFDGSLKAFKNVIVIAKDQPPADSANYNIGVLYAHPQNPRKDRQKAVGSFERVVTRLSGEPIGRTGQGLDRRPQRNRRGQSRKLSEPNSRLRSLSRKLKSLGSPPTGPNKRSKSPAWNSKDPGKKSKRSSRRSKNPSKWILRSRKSGESGADEGST